MKTSRPLLRAIAIKTGALLAFASALAIAQPGSPGGHGPGGISGIVLQSSIHTALALDTTQEAAWQQLQTDAATLRTSLETSRAAVQAVITAELARTTPDLVAIEDAIAAAREADDALIKALREKAIAFYASLNATQKAVVVAAFKAIFEHEAEGRPGRH